MGYSFQLTGFFYMHHPTDRIAHSTSCGALGGTRNSSMGPHPSPPPPPTMKDRSDDPSHHERTLLPQNYISLHVCQGHKLVCPIQERILGGGGGIYNKLYNIKPFRYFLSYHSVLTSSNLLLVFVPKKIFHFLNY